MRSISSQEVYRKAKVGTITGLVGGFAIIVFFIALDS